MKRNGYTLLELLAVIVLLGLLMLIITPVMVHVIEHQRGKARTESANGALNTARYFYTLSMIDDSIIYPSEGLEFICNKKVCEATVGTVTKEDGIAMISEEEPIKYQLDFKGQVPSSGSIVVQLDGNVFPKNLAIDSKLCVYDEKVKVFISC